MKTVAIQGIEGAYHEIAARKYFRSEGEIAIMPCHQFCDIVTALKKETDLFGIMAIENTIAGSLLQNYELIRENDLAVIGEEKLRISHCLAALPGQNIHDIKEIHSHPIALMQCRDFLNTLLDATIVEKDDTASSAANIAAKQIMGAAAICSRNAAELYGLEVLAEGIETNKHNFTRFLIVANRWIADEMMENSIPNPNKSSIVFTLPHKEGSLSKVLTILSFYDVNLTKIQSLPIIGREWEYLFYVDVTFNNYMRYKQSLDAVIPLTKGLKILGEYSEKLKVEN